MSAVDMRVGDLVKFTNKAEPHVSVTTRIQAVLDHINKESK